MEENRTALNKVLRPHWVWAIALGSSIGWGAFIQPVHWISIAGPLGVTIGFTIGALLMMIIAVSYGILIQKYPVSGGEFAYAYLSLGRTHAFWCGWFLTLGYICIVALNASALALLVKFVLPSLIERNYLYSIAGWSVYSPEIIIGILTLIMFAILNVKGTKFSGSLQFVFCLVMVCSVIILAVLTGNSPHTTSTNLLPLFSSNTTIFAGVLSIIAIAPWAFVGFDNVPQVAEEFNFSSRKAFKLIIFALAAAALLYILMIFATSVAMPWEELTSRQSVWGTAEAILGILGPLGMILLIIAVSMGIFTGLNGFIMSSSRLLFAMARAKVLPNAFAHIHPVYGTPHVSIWFTVIIAMVAPWLGRSALLWIVDMSSIGVSIAYFYTCFAAYRLIGESHRQNDYKDKERKFLVQRGFALLGCFLSIGFVALLVVPGSPAYLSFPSRIALLIWIVLGILFYLFKRKEYVEIPENQLYYLIIGKVRTRN